MVELIWEGKYDAEGRRVAPPRIALPFQTVETVNESAQERQSQFDLFATGRDPAWRNRLIWGDKKYVLPSLLPEFAGKVDLVYIDPPFDTGDDFSFTAQVPDNPETVADESTIFTKQPSMLEQKAYRDTWGNGLDTYVKWFYETAALLRELMADDGSIYVHLDWHVGHYAKIVLDDVFGRGSFRNEVVWYYRKYQKRAMRFYTQNSERLFWYVKDPSAPYTFNPQTEPLDKPKYLKRKAWDKDRSIIVNVRDAAGKLIYDEYADEKVDDVWDIPFMGATSPERTGFRTQKPGPLLERIVSASSNPGDLVLDCFSGSGTTAVEAEKLGRRWITADLGRFAIHTTRKRLLGIPDVKPFAVQNLGKYERQAWQTAEFGEREDIEARQYAYRNFILQLYKAEPVEASQWIHGRKSGRWVHVGAVDSPISPGDVTAIANSLKQLDGSGNRVDVLGWDFAFDLNETAKQQAARAGIDFSFKVIPREVLEKRAVEQGDIQFFELGALGVNTEVEGQRLTVTLTDLIVRQDDIPAEVRGSITHWSQMLDYWAIDWDFRDDTFHNQWQSYRTRKDPKLVLSAAHTYEAPGEYRVMVKAIDILGNDTTKVIGVTVS